MSFASPLILLFLIPWLGVAVWLLIGRRNRVAVPLLELWSGPEGTAKVKRTIQPPPVALICALLGMLLAILGAAAPMIRSRERGSRVTLIVDRCITMSAGSRRAEVAQALPNLVASQVMVVPRWSGLSADGSNWRDAPASAIGSQDLLRGAVAQALANTTEPIVVLSDQNLARQDRRIIQIAPKSMPQNVGVVWIAASTAPRPQVMLRLRNQSSLRSCDVSVTSAGQTVSKTISLPNGAETDAFIDMPKLGDTIEAKLSTADDLPLDNVAWLVRHHAWPRLEAGFELPAELRRMIDVYEKNRPPSKDSKRIAIVQNLDGLPSNAPAVAILRDEANARPSGEVVVDHADDPVISGVDWRAVVSDSAATGQPGAGWTSLVRSGDKTLVAVREKPARQVWVGFRSPSFATRKDFVIFWTNVFDWAGESGDEFAGESVQSISPEWTLQTPSAAGGIGLSPGIYRRDDGTRRALNCIDVHFSKPPQTEWRRQLASLPHSDTRGADLSPGTLVLAMLSILAAALLWKRHPAFAPAS